MIYELRTYHCYPGRLAALQQRFATWGLQFFARYEIQPVAFWTDPQGHLVYLVQFPDQAARDRAWAQLAADEAWQRVKAESEVDGPIVGQIESVILTPAPGLPSLAL